MKHKNNWYIIPHALIMCSVLTPNEKNLITRISSYTEQGQLFYETNNKLSEKIGCSPKTITRTISSLKKLRLIDVFWKVENGKKLRHLAFTKALPPQFLKRTIDIVKDYPNNRKAWTKFNMELLNEDNKHTKNITGQVAKDDGHNNPKDSHNASSDRQNDLKQIDKMTNNNKYYIKNNKEYKISNINNKLEKKIEDNTFKSCSLDMKTTNTQPISSNNKDFISNDNTQLENSLDDKSIIESNSNTNINSKLDFIKRKLGDKYDEISTELLPIINIINMDTLRMYMGCNKDYQRLEYLEEGLLIIKDYGIDKLKCKSSITSTEFEKYMRNYFILTEYDISTLKELYSKITTNERAKLSNVTISIVKEYINKNH